MVVLCALYLFLALLSPVIGVLVSFFVILTSHNKKYFTEISLFYLALFLGLLNSLKVHESDLSNYIYSYNLSPKKGWLDFMFFYDKEPFFYFFTKLINYIAFGSETLFVISFTILGYYLLFYSLLKIHR